MNAGRILLTPANLVLPGVEIKAEQAPLVMRKDTLEYNAGAFKTQPGAVVEDLLEKIARYTSPKRRHDQGARRNSVKRAGRR